MVVAAGPILVSQSEGPWPMDRPTVACWLIPLEGNPSDLAVLIAAFESQEVTVERREAGAALSMPAAVVGEDHSSIRHFAEERIAVVNGVGKLIDSGYRSVRLSDQLFGVDGSGKILHTVWAVKGVEARARLGTPIITIDGVRHPDPRTVTSSILLNGASNSRLAWDALVIAGRDSPTWPELYLAYELVKTGTEGRVAEVCGASKRELTLFSRTANSYAVLGREGRHGTTSDVPPEVPMSLSDATQLVRGLVESWLRYLGGAPASQHELAADVAQLPRLQRN